MEGRIDRYLEVAAFCWIVLIRLGQAHDDLDKTLVMRQYLNAHKN